MDDGGSVILVLFLVVFGVVAFLSYWFSKAARTRRALSAAGRTAIAEAKEGTSVKITGRLRLVGDPLEAPLSGRPCAAWEVTVDERRSSGKSSHWHRLVSEQESRDFLVEDDTGRALVKAVYPQMALEEDARFRSGTFEDATPELETFLASRGLQSTGLLGFNKSMRYREGALEEGEEVTVLGVCRWEPDPEPGATGGGYRTAAMRLVVEEPAEGRMLISDDPSAGR